MAAERQARQQTTGRRQRDLQDGQARAGVQARLLVYIVAREGQVVEPLGAMLAVLDRDGSRLAVFFASSLRPLPARGVHDSDTLRPLLLCPWGRETAE